MQQLLHKFPQASVSPVQGLHMPHPLVRQLRTMSSFRRLQQPEEGRALPMTNQISCCQHSSILSGSHDRQCRQELPCRSLPKEVLHLPA